MIELIALWIVAAGVYLVVGVSWTCFLRRFDLPWWAIFHFSSYREGFGNPDNNELGAAVFFWPVSVLIYVFGLILVAVLAFLLLPLKYMGKLVVHVCRK